MPRSCLPEAGGICRASSPHPRGRPAATPPGSLGYPGLSQGGTTRETTSWLEPHDRTGRNARYYVLVASWWQAGLTGTLCSCLPSVNIHLVINKYYKSMCTMNCFIEKPAHKTLPKNVATLVLAQKEHNLVG